ncbi:MAG: agarase, partial [Verrucomicrobia bacterium]|nr:agarase [Verrucomicrobiota bacterium]
MTMNRRRFLAAAGCAALQPVRTLRAAVSEKFFTLARRGGRWWFVTPEGAPFFSIALNHIDPSPLRYTANGDLWARKYGNSMERWLKEAVAPDLRAWG